MSRKVKVVFDDGRGKHTRDRRRQVELELDEGGYDDERCPTARSGFV